MYADNTLENFDIKNQHYVNIMLCYYELSILKFLIYIKMCTETKMVNIML